MKQLVRYKLNFDSKFLAASGVLMGMAFFMQAVYYFGVADLAQVGVAELILGLIMPMLLEAAWCILLRGIRLNAAGVFAILGAIFSLLLIVQTCFFGGVFQIILAILGYLLAAVAFLAVAGGFIPYRFVAATVYAVVLCIRFLAFGMAGFLSNKDWEGILLEAPALCLLAAMTCFFGGISPAQVKEE